jgi:hypothetical protein
MNVCKINLTVREIGCEDGRKMELVMDFVQWQASDQ